MTWVTKWQRFPTVDLRRYIVKSTVIFHIGYLSLLENQSPGQEDTRVGIWEALVEKYGGAFSQLFNPCQPCEETFKVSPAGAQPLVAVKSVGALGLWKRLPNQNCVS